MKETVGVGLCVNSCCYLLLASAFISKAATSLSSFVALVDYVLSCSCERLSTKEKN